MFASLWKSH